MTIMKAPIGFAFSVNKPAQECKASIFSYNLLTNRPYLNPNSGLRIFNYKEQNNSNKSI
jgi:hypothetical protein